MANIKVENNRVRFEDHKLVYDGEVTLPSFGFISDKPHFDIEFKDGKRCVKTLNTKFKIQDILGVRPVAGWWGEFYLKQIESFDKNYLNYCVLGVFDKSNKIYEYAIDIPFPVMAEWWKDVEAYKMKIESLFENYCLKINEEIKKTCI